MKQFIPPSDTIQVFSHFSPMFRTAGGSAGREREIWNGCNQGMTAEYRGRFHIGNHPAIVRPPPSRKAPARNGKTLSRAQKSPAR
jgi:hypothetical protein